MGRKSFVWFLAGLTLLLLVSGCASSDAEAADDPAPEQVVQAFYDWYLAYPGNALVDEAHRSSPYLSAGLVRQVDQVRASFTVGGYDPILCAQDIPNSLEVGEARVSGDQATVRVTSSFAGHELNIGLKRVDGAWKIDDTGCLAIQAEPPAPPPSPTAPPAQPTPFSPTPSPEPVAMTAEEEAVEPEAEQSPVEEGAGEAQVEGWQVLRDEGYGFQLRYPPDWTPVEIELRHPELDKPLVRMVHLLPQAWADEMSSGGPPDPSKPPIVAPLSIEVSLGTLEDYRRLYVEPTHVQALELGGQSVVLEEYDSGNVKEIRYLYQHPVQSELRVTLRDQLSGFPMRVEGNESVIETANLILTTFEFVE